MIVAKYYVESKLPLKIAGKRICEECSTGTWTEVTTTTKKIEELYSARVLKTEPRKRIVHIGIPEDLFEPGNIPQFLSVVAGNIFGFRQIDNLRLLDVKFSENFVKYFKGPRFGIEGIRKITGVKNRPLVGTIVKPKVGLPPDEYAKVVSEAILGGVDLVKMDETLTDQKFCRIEELVSWIMEIIEAYQQNSDRKILFAVNITTNLDKLLERADKVLALGANCLMIDIICMGLNSIDMLRNDPSIKVPIYCHRAGHAAFTKNEKHGISWVFYSRLARMLGADVLHAGTIIGKMSGEEKEELEVYKILRDEWFALNPVLPAASGGLYPQLIPGLIKYFGKDFIMNYGGGIHGHPSGTKAGAKAVRQALDATINKIDLKKYSMYKENKELRDALEKWK